MKVYDRIRLYIQNNGITFSFIANRSGIDDSKFSRIMTGKQRMKVDEYEKICTALHLPLVYFFDDDSLKSKNCKQEVTK